MTSHEAQELPRNSGALSFSHPIKNSDAIMKGVDIMFTALIFILGVETPLSIIGLIAIRKLFGKGKEVMVETIEENENETVIKKTA